MKRFRFSLERVLQLRSRAEREQAQKVGHALQAEEERKRALEAAQDQVGRAGEQIAGATSEVATAGALRNLGLTLHAAVQAREQAEQRHEDAKETVREEQERFGEARKERRVVERLREHQQERWTREASRREQAEVDEVAIQRHGKDDES